MTQFQQDLWKIVVDKGLLGAIAVLFGYILSRGLERYKARTIYLQKLAERRLDACERLTMIIQDQCIKVGDVAQQLERGQSAKLIQVLETARQALDRDISEAMKIIGLYLPNYGERCAQPQILIGKFYELFERRAEVDDAIPTLRKMANEIMASLTELHSSLRAELNKPPF